MCPLTATGALLPVALLTACEEMPTTGGGGESTSAAEAGGAIGVYAAAAGKATSTDRAH